MQLIKIQEAQKFQDSIISKCWEDSKFKTKLIANPLEALESFTGNPINVPEGKRLVVVDQSQNPDVLYFNIPAEPNLDDLKLSDEELEAVSGGTDFVTGFVITAAIIGFFHMGNQK